MRAVRAVSAASYHPRMLSPVDIRVIDDQRDERCRQLADRLGIPAVPAGDSTATRFVLDYVQGRLELRERGSRPGQGLCVDFESHRLRRTTRNLSRRQPLARAIGRAARTVVDATAGLGEDAMLLAEMGYEVTAIERSPVIAALLRDGLLRGGSSLVVIEGDAAEVIPGLDPAPEVIYIDPMFPPKRKRSALASKKNRLIRAVVGEDADAGALLELAIRSAVRRVVVKRPTWRRPFGRGPITPAPASSPDTMSTCAAGHPPRPIRATLVDHASAIARPSLVLPSRAVGGRRDHRTR